MTCLRATIRSFVMLKAAYDHLLYSREMAEAAASSLARRMSRENINEMTGLKCIDAALKQQKDILYLHLRVISFGPPRQYKNHYPELPSIMLQASQIFGGADMAVVLLAERIASIDVGRAYSSSAGLALQRCPR